MVTARRVDRNGMIRGVTRATPRAHRIQAAIALGVLIVPAVGVVAAVWEACTVGVRRGEVALMLVMYVLTVVGVTMGYHRHCAHRAFQTSRTMQAVLVYLGAMAGQGPLLFWVATHRRHHAYSDRPGDPHSPYRGDDGRVRWKGLIHAHLGWLLSSDVTSWAIFAGDLVRDRFIYALHRRYAFALGVGLLIPALVGAALWGGCVGLADGFVWGGLVRMFLVNHASWCVGSVAHAWGQRPFLTKDRSANNWVVALLSAGEGLQNNHHAFPSSAFHALQWWEPDFTGSIIGICERLGLVWGVKRPSAIAIRFGREGGKLSHIGEIEGVTTSQSHVNDYSTGAGT